MEKVVHGVANPRIEDNERTEHVPGVAQGEAIETKTIGLSVIVLLAYVAIHNKVKQTSEIWNRSSDHG